MGRLEGDASGDCPACQDQNSSAVQGILETEGPFHPSKPTHRPTAIMVHVLLEKIQVGKELTTWPGIPTAALFHHGKCWAQGGGPLRTRVVVESHETAEDEST